MEKWEYCSVDLGWSGGFGNKYIAYIHYYRPEGRRVEEIPTNYKRDKDLALHAIGQALTILGRRGWEAVWLQHETYEKGFGARFEALLKRRVDASSP